MRRQDKTGTWAQEMVSRQSLKYDIALRAGTVPARKDSDLKSQSRRYAEAVGAIRQRELQAREVLMRHGVLSCQFMPYFRFVRFLCRMSKESRGAAFELEAEAAVARWTGQGCSPELLSEVVLAVFNLRLETDRVEPRMDTDDTECHPERSQAESKGLSE
jgi:hypothetical protein